MKRSATKSLRSGLAFVLVLCMMFSLCGAAFAADADKAVDDIEDAIGKLATVVENYFPKMDDEAWTYVEKGDYRDALNDTIDELLKICAEDIAAYKAGVSPAAAETVNGLAAELKSLREDLTQDDAKLRDLTKALKKLYDSADKLAPAVGQSADEVKAEIKAVDERVQSVLAKVNNLTAEIAAINTQLERANALLKAVNGTSDSLVSKIREKAAQVDTLTDADYANLAARAEEYVYFARDMYKMFEDIESASNDAVALLQEVKTSVNDTKDDLKEIHSEMKEVGSGLGQFVKPFVEVVKSDVADINAGVADQEGIQAKIDYLQSEYEAYVKGLAKATDDAINAATSTLKDKENEIQAKLAKLYKELEEAEGGLPTAATEKRAELQGQQKQLRDALNELYNALTEASGETRAVIEAEIEQANKQIDEAEAQIVALDNEIETAEANAKVTIEELKKAIDYAEQELSKVREEAEKIADQYTGEAQNDATKQRYEKMIADLEEQAKNLGKDTIEHLNNAEQAAEAALNDYKQAKKDCADALDTISMESLDEMMDAIEGAADKLQGYVDTIKSEIKAIREDVVKVVRAMKNIVKKNYEQYVATHEYELKDTNMLLAISDDRKGANYTSLLAGKLQLDVDTQVVNMPYYDHVDEVNADEIASEIADADIITVSFNPMTYANDLLAGSFDFKSADWSKCTYSGANYIKLAMNTLEAELKAHFSDENVKYIMQAVGAYTYAYMLQARNYAPVVNAIHEKNPEAIVAVIGICNTFEGLEVEYRGHTVPVGWFFNQLSDFIDACYIAYCMKSEHTIYIPIRNAETRLSMSIKEGNVDLSKVGIYNMLTDYSGVILTANGESIVSQDIYNALTLFRNILPGDCNANVLVELNDLALFRRYIAGISPKVDRWNTGSMDNDADYAISNDSDLRVMRNAFAVTAAAAGYNVSLYNDQTIKSTRAADNHEGVPYKW